jgi:hypothetical protein
VPRRARVVVGATTLRRGDVSEVAVRRKLRCDVDWPDENARARAESAAGTVAELGPEHAGLYFRAAWLAATDRALNRTSIGADDVSELGRAAERLCMLLHDFAVEGEADAPVGLHLVERPAANG